LRLDTVLIAYGEITLKSKPVRAMLERRLVSQASLVLRMAGVREFRIHRKPGRIVVKCGEALRAA